jgi:hypothetical protein
MFARTKKNAGWTRRQLAVITALPVLMVLPIASQATAREMAETVPAGTEFKLCTDTAWSNYNECLVTADRWYDRTLCDLAFEGDIVWCGSVYRRRVSTGT